MRLITYADVADAIARAETTFERRAASSMLASYYALHPRESTVTRVRILKDALLRQLAESQPPSPERA